MHLTRRDDDEVNNSVKITFQIPVHKKLGVQFKPYIDVMDLNLQDIVIKTLENEGMEDISVSFSPEAQRVYFLYPSSSKLNIITTAEGIKNNYIYPL